MNHIRWLIELRRHDYDHDGEGDNVNDSVTRTIDENLFTYEVEDTSLIVFIKY